MDLKILFQDFNPSKFLVFSSLLLFSLLFALRLDGIIMWNYWIVFMPIWIWKIMVIAGSLTGIYIWCKNPQIRSDGDNTVQFKAMIITTSLHVPLLVFEMLVCNKLENDKPFWILVFVPLFAMSVVSIGLCIWAVKNERGFELELFCATNILQFIFIALRLDGFIKWSWVIVFIPLWIIMCVAMIGVLYVIILAIILAKSNDIMPEQRRGNVCSAIGYTFLVIPLLIFEILLSNKLDYQTQETFVVITLPLLLSFLTYILMSFGAKGGNQWWFGIRKDFCHFLLGVCPLLQEYGNITIKMKERSNEGRETRRDQEKDLTKSASIHYNKQLLEQQTNRMQATTTTIFLPD